MTLFERLLDRIALRRKIVPGCREPGPLLVRYTLFSSPLGNLYIHHFLRSDEDRELHDHPWAFVAFILAGGYTEVRPVVPIRRMLLAGEPGYNTPESVQERKWCGPGSLLVRPARWAHRVEISPGRDSWSLIFVRPKSRDWGFFTLTGWTSWRTYHSTAGCADGVAASMRTGGI